jgi:hypothetical protein
MRKILFVHSSFSSQPGGAEQSLRYHLEHAPKSVRVTTITPEEKCNIAKYDAIVLGNLRPHGGLGAEAEIMWMLRWTKLLQDFRGFSLRSERDVHPCTYRDGRCLVGKRLKKVSCSCSFTQRDASELLYNSCSAVQFLSPAHQKAINQLITITSPQYAIGSPVDLDQFRITVPQGERQAKALILGDAIRVADTAEQRARDAGYEPERVKYLSVPFEQMPALYNQYQAVVVDPIMFHAFGRIAVEAMACGCRVLASERVGAMSWPDPIQASQESNSKFWSLLDRNYKSHWLRSFSRRSA